MLRFWKKKPKNPTPPPPPNYLENLTHHAHKLVYAHSRGWPLGKYVEELHHALKGES